MFLISVSTWHDKIYERTLTSTFFSVGFYPDAGAGPSSSSFRPDNETFTLDDFDSLTPDSPGAHGDPDVLGYSRLGGAPLGISQQQTPQPLSLPERQVRSPDAF